MGWIFWRLINFEEDREAEIVAFERETGVNMLGGLNDSQTTKEEVQETVKEMKVGKAVGLDRCAVECLKSVVEFE